MVTKKFNFFQLRSKLQFWFSEDYLLEVKIMKSSRYSHFINHEIPAATAVIKYLGQKAGILGNSITEMKARECAYLHNANSIILLIL